VSLRSNSLSVGTVAKPRPGSARSRGPALLVTGSALVSDTNMMRLIDEAIVPAMVDRFLAEKGLVPERLDEDQKRPLGWTKTDDNRDRS